jgi:hypothetical protein
MNEGFGMSALATGAAVLHETYTELRAAGFTQSEALEYLVKLARS